MKVDEIREIAIDSAKAYYRYLDENDKGVQEVEVTELSYPEGGGMLIIQNLSKLRNANGYFYNYTS